MIRVVIDTNIIISYTMSRGSTLTRLMDYWFLSEAFVYVTSPTLIAELENVLHRPRLQRHFKIDVQSLLSTIKAEAVQTPGTLTIPRVCRDPNDDMFLACAIEGQADYIVTGDKDLLVLKEYQGIQIVAVESFVSILNITAP